MVGKERLQTLTPTFLARLKIVALYYPTLNRCRVFQTRLPPQPGKFCCYRLSIAELRSSARFGPSVSAYVVSISITSESQRASTL